MTHTDKTAIEKEAEEFAKQFHNGNNLQRFVRLAEMAYIAGRSLSVAEVQHTEVGHTKSVAVEATPTKAQQIFLEDLESQLIKTLRLKNDTFEYNDVREFCNRIRRWVFYTDENTELTTRTEEQLNGVYGKKVESVEAETPKIDIDDVREIMSIVQWAIDEQRGKEEDILRAELQRALYKLWKIREKLDSLEQPKDREIELTKKLALREDDVENFKALWQQGCEIITNLNEIYEKKKSLSYAQDEYIEFLLSEYDNVSDGDSVKNRIEELKK